MTCFTCKHNPCKIKDDVIREVMDTVDKNMPRLGTPEEGRARIIDVMVGALVDQCERGKG